MRPRALARPRSRAPVLPHHGALAGLAAMRPRAQARLPSRAQARLRHGALTGLAALALATAGSAAALLPFLGPAPARAADGPVRLLVDAVRAGGPDADTADGLCATAAGDCTLRAAIEQANALPADQAVEVGVATAFAGGTIEMSRDTSDYMTPVDASIVAPSAGW